MLYIINYFGHCNFPCNRKAAKTCPKHCTAVDMLSSLIHWKFSGLTNKQTQNQSPSYFGLLFLLLEQTDWLLQISSTCYKSRHIKEEEEEEEKSNKQINSTGFLVWVFMNTVCISGWTEVSQHHLNRHFKNSLN